ncbi:MAG: DUF885 domain-containing protein [Proteobacteria bacterium]|nr:DUF885 domain-containing protein [Pseudomonadota bacterium]
MLVSIYAINLFLMKPYSMDHYLAKELITSLFESPETMTYMGLFDRVNFITGHNAKLSVRDAEDAEADHQKNLARLDMLKRYQNDSLSSNQLITKKIAIFDTENDINAFENFRYHTFPVNQIGGTHLNLVEFMTDIHPIRSHSEAKDFISRIGYVEKAMNNQILWLQEQANAGIFPPKFVYEHVINQLEGMVAGTESPLLDVFVRKIGELDLSNEKKEILIADLNNALNTSFYPAYNALLDYFRDTQGLASIHDGAWSLPNGDEYYALRLRSYTTTDFSAQQIHDIGLSEVSRITKRMGEILDEIGYQSNKPVGLIMNDMNEDENFLYADSPDRKEIVIADYNEMVTAATLGMKDYFYKLPNAAVEVRAVPEYSEKTQAGGYYMSPSLDGKRPGVFYANLYDIKQTPTYSMQALAFHEAIPGHHLQIALNLENEDLTIYRRFGYRTSAFSEGWALYSEQLALEAGLARNLLDELGVLQSELFRSVRLVVDTGMHYKRWTREEAMDYMKRITGMSDTEVRAEIERYIVWPGQATSYKVGMLKILELRKTAQEKLGNNFDIKKFHSIVLDNGIPPLFVLEDLVNEWIASEA